MYNNATKLYDHYLQLTKEEIEGRYERVLREICNKVSDGDDDSAKERLSQIENDLLDLDMVIEG